VALWRRLSPESIAVETPGLRPDLAARSKLRLAVRPKAVLFDIYGTLLVSAAGAEPNLGAAFSGGGGEAGRLLEGALAPAGYSKGASGFAEELAERIADRHRLAGLTAPHPEIDIEILVGEILPTLSEREVRRIALLHEAAVNPCAPMPGARLLLDRLARSGVRLGLVSNAQFYTPLLLEALFGTAPEALGFEEALTSYSFTLGIAKPDSRPFESAIRILAEAGIARGEILFVGNSSANDVAPARKLGLRTALFAGDARSFRPSEPGTPGSFPDLVLAGLHELAEKIAL
jgi:putative hydrolase of the HAD superfamily